MSQVEVLFKHPQQEIEAIEKDLNKQFDVHLVSYIKEQAVFYSSGYHDDCASILLQRFVQINQIAESLPENLTQNEYDAFVQKILTLVNPKEIFEEIESIILNSNVQNHYESFMRTFENDLFSKVFEQNAFPKDLLVQLNQLAMVQIEHSVKPLHDYIHSLHKHNELITLIRENNKGNSVLKAGASVLGMGLGIPFLGTGLGKLLSAGDSEKIQDSLGNVLDHVAYLEESLYETVQKLGDSLYLLFFTLISGTFIATNHALQSQNLCLKGMSKEQTLIYTLTDQEEERFLQWFNTSLLGVTKLVTEKRWQDAIRIIKEMHRMVSENPLHASYEVLTNKAALYLVHVYYYAIYQEALLEEYRAGHVKSFLTHATTLLDSLILYPLEKDMPAFASHPGQFLFLYVKQYMHEHNGRLYWMEQARAYIAKRRKKRLLAGELGEGDQDYFKNTKSFHLMTAFAKDEKQSQSKQSTSQLYQQLSRKEIKQFIQLDRSLNKTDNLTAFLQTIQRQKRKELIWPALRIGLVAAFLATTLLVVTPRLDNITESLSNTKSTLSTTWATTKEGFTDKWHAIFGKEEEIDNSFTEEIIITEEMVNLRSEPSLDDNVLAIGYDGETYLFSGMTYTDDAGTTWLEILLPDERIAYVSQKVIQVNE